MMQTEHIIILSIASITLLVLIVSVVLSYKSLATQIDLGNNEKDIKQKVDYMDSVLRNIQNRFLPAGNIPSSKGYNPTPGPIGPIFPPF